MLCAGVHSIAVKPRYRTPIVPVFLFCGHHVLFVYYQALHYSLPLQAFCLTALTRDPRLRKSAVNTFRRLPDICSN